jgi:hypothetical protein
VTGVEITSSSSVAVFSAAAEVVTGRNTAIGFESCTSAVDV